MMSHLAASVAGVSVPPAVAGLEERCFLDPTLGCLVSVLPSPQSSCPGFHLRMSRAIAAAPLLPAASPWSALRSGAPVAHAAGLASLSAFSPRALGAGFACPCGARDASGFGQVLRSPCPACGGLARLPTRSGHFVPLASLPPSGSLAGAGLPPGDVIWSLAAGSPVAAARPWRLAAAPSLSGVAPRIGVLGLGALGFPVAEVLHRLGYALDLIDFDAVEEKNLAASYSRGALGMPKPDALAHHLHAISPSPSARAIHGDITRDIALGTFAGWAAAVLCLDRMPPKCFAADVLGMFGIPYISANIDGQSGQAVVRSHVPGETACLQCLLSEDEIESDVAFSCRPEPDPVAAGDPRPRLFTTAVESRLGAALVGARLTQMVPLPVDP